MVWAMVVDADPLQPRFEFDEEELAPRDTPRFK